MVARPKIRPKKKYGANRVAGALYYAGSGGQSDAANDNNYVLKLIANNCNIANNLYSDTNPVKNQRTAHMTGPTGCWITNVEFVNGYLGTNQESSGFHDINLEAGILVENQYTEILFDGKSSKFWDRNWGEAVGSCYVYVPENTRFYINSYMEAADAASHLITYTGMTRGATTIMSYTGVDPTVGDTVRLSGFVVAGSGAITGITNANPCVVTSAGHGLQTGNFVTFASIAGTTQLNGNTYRVVRIDADTFSLTNAAGTNTNSTAFGVYSGPSGTWTAVSELHYATNNSVAYKVANLDTNAKTFELQTTANAAVNSTNYSAYASGGQSLRVYTWAYSTTSPGVNGNGMGYTSHSYAGRENYKLGVGLPGGVLPGSLLPIQASQTSGGTITTATKGSSGSDAVNGVGALYDGAPSISFWYGIAGVNQAGSDVPGTSAASGYTTMSSGLYGSVVISSVGAGHDENELPEPLIGGGSTGGFGVASMALWGPSAIYGIPDDSSVRSALVIGDSIVAGASPDLNGNKGIYEHALDNLCGVMKIAVNGDSALGWLSSLGGGLTNHTYRTRYLTNLIKRGCQIDVAAVCLGANDFNTNNSPTIVTTLAGYIDLIMQKLETAGVKSCIASTVTPRQTGTYTSDGGQTPYTVIDAVNGNGTQNYEAGGRVETYNRGIRLGSLVPRAKNYVDLNIIMASPTAASKWRNEGQFTLQYSTGVAFTGDGIHPNGTAGIPYARAYLDIRCFGITDRQIAMSRYKSGRLGERVRARLAVGSATSLVNDTDKTILNLKLTEGIWDLDGKVVYVGTSATITNLKSGISQRNNTHGTLSDNFLNQPVSLSSFTGETEQLAPRQTIRVPKGKTTDIYLIGRGSFSGTLTGYGHLNATRVGNLHI